MRFSRLVTLLGVAFALPPPRYVHETRSKEPIGWVKTGRLNSAKMLPMRFGLVQQNLHKLEEMLMSVSHPESSSYAQYLTPKEVHDAFAPSEESIAAVADWLVDSGFSRDRLRLSGGKGWIHVDASTSEVENLLNTEYHVYTHPSGDSQIGCHNYSLPSHLREHVDLIKPTVHFNHQPVSAQRKRAQSLGQPFAGRGTNPKKSQSEPSSTLSKRSLPSTCDPNSIDPACLTDLYSINYTLKSPNNNSLAIVAFPPNWFSQSDLDEFFQKYAPNLKGMTPQVEVLDQSQSANKTIDLGLTAILEYSMTLMKSPYITLLEGGHTELTNVSIYDPFNVWLEAVDGTYCDPGGGSCDIHVKPPNVVVVPYNVVEEDSFMIADMTRQCREYAKLGMMGTTVICQSGNDGVTGIKCPAPGQTFSFGPQFPATCPYVTAVGGTLLLDANDPEIAWNSSGGGFSNVFSLPEYQKDAVQNYSRKYLNPAPFPPGVYNDSGKARAYPDLAVLSGPAYDIVANGTFQARGTASSVGVVGTMIAMVNDARITKGKSLVGFINPALYQMNASYVFNDITSGQLQGCDETINAFNATPGWDPASGLGSPNFEKLLAFFLKI